MNHKGLLAVCVVSTLTLSACTLEKTNNPLAPTVAGPLPGVNITTPSPLRPEHGSRLHVAEQPLTLVVANATTSGIRPLSYLFEVAADAAFSGILYSNVVAPGDGQTSYRLPDALAPDRSYYWRSRAQDGANTGPYSLPMEFQIVTGTVFSAPVLITPIDNIVVGNLRPRFSWLNAQRTGSSGPVSYVIQLSDTSSFALSVTVTVPEQAGSETSVDPPQNLPANRQGFWRVHAFDSSGAGPWSITQSFSTPAAPSGGGGSGGGGNEGGVPGCSGGRLQDPKAYFFALIGRAEGSPAPDWAAVLAASGIPDGYGPFQLPNYGVHYGITQQMGFSGPRGVVYLPTAAPDDLGYYTRQILVVENYPANPTWAWIDRFAGGPAYAPGPCP
jgi:hypothetical protein